MELTEAVDSELAAAANLAAAARAATIQAAVGASRRSRGLGRGDSGETNEHQGAKRQGTN